MESARGAAESSSGCGYTERLESLHGDVMMTDGGRLGCVELYTPHEGPI